MVGSDFVTFFVHVVKLASCTGYTFIGIGTFRSEVEYEIEYENFKSVTSPKLSLLPARCLSADKATLEGRLA